MIITMRHHTIAATPMMTFAEEITPPFSLRHAMFISPAAAARHHAGYDADAAPMSARAPLRAATAIYYATIFSMMIFLFLYLERCLRCRHARHMLEFRRHADAA